MSRTLCRRDFLGLAGGGVLMPTTGSDAQPKPADQPQRSTSVQSYISDDGVIEVQGHSLPPSGLLSAKSRTLFVEQARLWESINADFAELSRTSASIAEIRTAYSQRLLPALRKQQDRHPTQVEQAQIAGVKVHRLRPAGARAEDRVLISLHGGGFSVGAGVSALIEAIPITAVSGLEVISVDYRMAPEHLHPAALNDVVAVYKHLLREHPALSIGIFGSSAGALLTAQVMSHLISANIPTPGALGMFALGAGRTIGDSVNVFGAIDRLRSGEGRPVDYLANVERTDPTGFPAEFPERMARFPPSLLISSTRDIGLSSVADTHARLVRAGVEAALHVWEGLRHCFYYDPEFEESTQMYEVAARFFRGKLREGG